MNEEQRSLYYRDIMEGRGDPNVSNAKEALDKIRKLPKEQQAEALKFIAEHKKGLFNDIAEAAREETMDSKDVTFKNSSFSEKKRILTSKMDGMSQEQKANLLKELFNKGILTKNDLKKWANGE